MKIKWQFCNWNVAFITVIKLKYQVVILKVEEEEEEDEEEREYNKWDNVWSY